MNWTSNRHPINIDYCWAQNQRSFTVNYVYGLLFKVSVSLYELNQQLSLC